MSLSSSTKKVSALLLGVALLLLGLVSSAQAAGPELSVAFSHGPEIFQRGDSGDSYTVSVTNTGDTATSGPITLTDAFTGGVQVRLVNGNYFECPSVSTPLTCTSTASIAPGETLGSISMVVVTPVDAADTVTSEVTVSGGGAPSATFSDSTSVVDRSPFEIQNFTARSLDEEGNEDTAAGGHPYEGDASFSFPSYPSSANSLVEPVEDVKDIITELPPGFAGNASAFPRCPLTGLQSPFFANCPAASQIGTLALGTDGIPGTPVPLYNMVPENGFPAEFAFKFANDAVVIFPRLRPRTGGYGLDLVTPGAARLGITSIAVKLWGVPSMHNGVGGPPAPLLFNPVDCQETYAVTTNIADTWENPAREFPGPDFGTPDLSDPLWKVVSFPSPPVTGCESPALTSQFDPSMAVKPVQEGGSVQADQPAGLNVALDFPQTNDPTVLSTVFNPSLPQAPELKTATVTLPAGVSISPSAADGLVGCSDQASNPAGDQVHYDNTEPVSCPESSIIGSVVATSPLLASHDPVTDAVTGAEPIHGDVYVLKPHPGDLTQGQNGTFRVLIQVESEKDGLNVKLPGTIVADKSTGQLTATFTENPQLPISHLELDLHSGPRAPLATPVTCGTFTTGSDLVPWSTPGTPDATPSSSFAVNSGANGSPCVTAPQQRPFAPALSANTESATAGTSSPFVLKLARNDGEQELGSVDVSLPAGFTAKLAGVPYCPEAAINAASGRSGAEELASPSCPEASQVGTLTTGAGPGTNPYYVNGKVYLAGSYEGAPLSLVFVTPAVAGPFDLGTVVVRAAVFINSETAQVTVKTDPLPRILDGIPLRIRSIVARVDRPGFILNPTNCTQFAVNATIASSEGATTTPSVPFQAANCASMPFKPAFTAFTSAKTSKANGASLTVKLAQKAGEANIHRVKVELPKILPSRLTTLQKACTAAQFNMNPAGCPAESVVGHAKATTPVLPVPLEGPAYFVSHGGEAFPSLIVVLQGDGITIDLDGTTFIDHHTGVTSSTFAAVPDVPVSAFELTLPMGKYSALAVNLPEKDHGNLCGQKLTMPASFTGQNGAETSQSTPITVEGCPSTLSFTHTNKKKTLTLTIYAPAAGKITVTGKGLTKAAKTTKGQENITLTLKQKKAGRLKTTVKVAFTPSAGKDRKKQAKNAKVTFKK